MCLFEGDLLDVSETGWFLVLLFWPFMKRLLQLGRPFVL